MCSSTGWKFTAIVFPKVYNQVAHLFKEGEIVLVKGKLNCKIEMKEISIEADQVKRSTISDLRTAAHNDGIFGDEEPVADVEKTQKDTQEAQPNKPLFPSLTDRYTCDITPTTLTIKLPTGTQKDTLMDIKTLLESYPTGPYHVWLDIGGQMIDTKRSIG